MFRFLLSLAMMVVSLFAKADAFDSAFFHARYGLSDPYTKLIDNKGGGYEPLYGLRNVREVLKGVLFRGGANNVFNRNGRRANSNPLPPEGLDHLCEEGFTTAVYLYSVNYRQARHHVDCRSVRGANHLDYLQIDPKKRPEDILRLIYTAIFNPARGPIYVHCWNGWHASGLISALALRQFCGVSAEQAVSYWVHAVDGNDSPQYKSIKNQIRQFVPRADLMISASEQARLCPSL